MGLDMFLTGTTTPVRNPKNKKMQGFEVGAYILNMGYWRKLPNLHGYIVKHFAEGEDKGQEIYLDKAALEQILKAVKTEDLPHPEGFVFGSSNPEYKPYTIETLEKAITWLDTVHYGYEWKSVIYRASW